jgi:glutamate synthase domain-containing protein 1
MAWNLSDVIPYNEKDTSGCGLTAFINCDGSKVGGRAIIDSIEHIRERGNGLGGGFAVYGLYDSYKEQYAFHVMYDDNYSKAQGENYIKDCFDVIYEEQMPTRQNAGIKYPPRLFRYFVNIADTKLAHEFPDVLDNLHEYKDEYVLNKVMHINKNINGVFVVSSGKNMGAFKGVGEAHDIGDFFCLDNYKAHTWLAHSRFPTNTPGWWGGAHPFTMLDYSVVHNGEISSYGINKRYLESFGYECTMRTDTEVVAYAVDLLKRRHNLPWELVAKVLASPFWKDIDIMDEDNRALYTMLRVSYGGALLNGPFAFVIGFHGGMVALSDRVKLRPLVAARKGKTIYVSSEEASIRKIQLELDEVWHPAAGEPVFAFLDSYVE